MKIVMLNYNIKNLIINKHWINKYNSVINELSKIEHTHVFATSFEVVKKYQLLHFNIVTTIDMNNTNWGDYVGGESVDHTIKFGNITYKYYYPYDFNKLEDDTEGVCIIMKAHRKKLMSNIIYNCDDKGSMKEQYIKSTYIGDKLQENRLYNFYICNICNIKFKERNINLHINTIEHKKKFIKELKKPLLSKN